MAADATDRAIEAVFRIERARLIASLARITRDVDRAEELAQDALLIALAEWPKTGVPKNPGAWLTVAAKRRAIDGLRHAQVQDRTHEEISRYLDEADDGVEALDAAMDDDIGDELLGLIFVACDPVLSAEARIALTLRLIGGLTTEEIARAFLSSEATIAQRIVRAKKKLGSAGLAFEMPRGRERDSWLASVLEVVYLIFNEGYAATAGEDLIRPSLCAEAQRLARILAGIMPDEPEVFGLLALVEIQASRLPARIGADGAFVSLAEQSRARWDQLLIRRGLAALARAEQWRRRPICPPGGARGLSRPRARGGGDRLAPHRRSIRSTARGHAVPYCRAEPGRRLQHGVQPGGRACLGRRACPDCDSSQLCPLPAARGDFLFRAGRRAEARVEFELAAGFTRNLRERAFLLERASSC